MDGDPLLLKWTETLSGLDAKRVEAARREIRSWGFSHVERALLADSVDAYVAAYLLIEALARLQRAGIDRARLMKKLRKEPDVWGTWAEFRVAHSLLQSHLRHATVRLEDGRSAGAHADFQFVLADDPHRMSVEVKAVGLSDEEVAFCERMAPSLEAMLPSEGLGHIHAPIDGKPPRLSRDMRRQLAREAKRASKRTPMWIRGLQGAVIVAHGSEPGYAKRVGWRVAQAVRQLPETDRCWVAIHWSNGAPFETVRRNIPWSEIPEHVEGVFLVGCGIAFPHSQVHCFATPLHRQLADAQLEVRSTDPEQHELAAVILDRFERSSGVRATLLRAHGRTLLQRDGSARFWPFNLLMDADRPDLGRDAVNAPWMLRQPRPTT